MAFTKERKKETVERVRQVAKGSVSLVFSDFNGLSVAESLALRRSLRAKGVGYVVVKKTLAKRALQDTGIGGDMPDFSGQLGIAYLSAGFDALEPARGIYEFQKKLEGKIVISGGVFEGKFVSKEGMTEIARIPSRLVLLAQLVNLINSPIQRLVGSLDAIGKKKS